VKERAGRAGEREEDDAKLLMFGFFNVAVVGVSALLCAGLRGPAAIGRDCALRDRLISRLLDRGD
jgi:hypothetical protein